MRNGRDDLSVYTVAKRLEVSKQYVQRLIDEGRLEAIRTGRCWRIPAAAFERFVLILIGRGDEINLDQK